MFLEFRRENKGEGKFPVVIDIKRLEKRIENNVRGKRRSRKSRRMQRRSKT